jgi:membrane protein implicated in regulation of membrane protease activity
MIWWYWVVLGLLLTGLELATPGGFFLLFFGVGALLVGGLVTIGAAGPAWVQWLLFSVLSVAALMFFRAPLLRLMQARTPRSGDIDSLRGEVAVAMDGIPAGGLGRAQLRGTVWTARNLGTNPITPGERCLVTSVDGLTISIRREGAL